MNDSKKLNFMVFVKFAKTPDLRVYTFKIAVLLSRSRKEPHHFGRARAGALTRYDFSSKADVQHTVDRLLKNVTKCNNFILFLFLSTVQTFDN
jgi:hypothetical protein